MNTSRLGLITDLHFAHRPALGSRDYALSLDKLRFTIDRFNAAQLDLLVVLGDLIDAPDDPPAEQAALAEIIDALRTFRGQVRIAAGNHDLVNFTKPQFLAACHQTDQPALHHAFDHQSIRIIILDGCFSADDTPYGGALMNWADSKVSDDQLRFLADQLRIAEQTRRPALVLMHQTLTCPDTRHNIANADRIIDMLANSRCVIAAISGHYHPGGTSIVRNIPCITLPATVESTTPPHTAGRIVTITDQRHIIVEGLHPLPADFHPATLAIGDDLFTVRPATLDEILPLRQAVLIPGTNRDSPIFEGDHAPTTLHFGIFDSSNHPVACATLMLQNDTETTPAEPHPAWRLRGTATHPAHQRKGLGKALLRYMQQSLADTQGPQRLWCNARTSAVPFYRTLGWQSTGEPFTIPGVGPHLHMIRWL